MMCLTRLQIYSYIEIALEEIDGGLQKASLIIDLKTCSGKESQFLLHKDCTEEVLTASDNSGNLNCSKESKIPILPDFV